MKSEIIEWLFYLPALVSCFWTFVKIMQLFYIKHIYKKHLKLTTLDKIMLAITVFYSVYFYYIDHHSTWMKT